jgi:hypothetical protein
MGPREEQMMRTGTSSPVTFDTSILASGNNTGIEVPEWAIDQLAAGKRPAVLVDVNGYRYRSTVAVMGGKFMIGISAVVRDATGLRGGDPIHVTLAVAQTPREVNIPPDLAAALEAHPSAKSFFATLANSMQRYHIDNVNGAKSPETRQRRIDKAVTLFLGGKQR